MAFLMAAGTMKPINSFSAFYGNTLVKGRKAKEGAEELDDMLNMIFCAGRTLPVYLQEIVPFFCLLPH